MDLYMKMTRSAHETWHESRVKCYFILEVLKIGNNEWKNPYLY